MLTHKKPNMLFLSTYINKIDKKGRVSVPANFRAVIRKEEYQGVIAYGSFINDCVEASGISRVNNLNKVIDSLDPFSEERDAFATTILGASSQLPFDSDGRILLSEKLMELASLKDKALFIGKGETFEIWNPDGFEAYAEKARRIAKEKRLSLKFNNIRGEHEKT
jgi:MraZ protein